MRFVEVNELPEHIRSTKSNFKHRLDEFMAMNIKVARVEFDSSEYNSRESCRGAFVSACKRYSYPIRAVGINGDVYLIRKDL